MKYKNNVLDKINQTEAVIRRLQVQINHNSPKEELNETMERLMESTENIRSMVSVESDDFEQQFSPR